MSKASTFARTVNKVLPAPPGSSSLTGAWDCAWAYDRRTQALAWEASGSPGAGTRTPAHRFRTAKSRAGTMGLPT